MNKKFARAVAIITLVAMLITTVTFVAVAPFAFGAEKGMQLTDEETFRNFLLKNYKDKLSPAMLEGKTIEEMAAYLHEQDPYTELFSKEMSEKFSEFVEGEYVGIGITATAVPGGIKIVEVNPEGTAIKAGMKVDDLIIGIDGIDVRYMELTKALDIIKKGKKNTVVYIYFIRGNKVYRATPTRAFTRSQSVKYSFVEGYPTIGYIKISSFDSDTAQEFAGARIDLIKRGAKAFVIDLRDNPGGILEEGVAVAEQILPQFAKITNLKNQGKVVQEHTVREGTKVLYPTVCLINENSASASEILAGALQDNGVAKMVGVTTYGKGVAQQIFPLSDGKLAKVSVLYFTTPKGHVINKVGIKPDVPVYNILPATPEEKAEIARFSSMDGIKKYKQGEYGSVVYGAQQRLKMLGYYKGNLNGSFDKATADAVMSFQKARALYSYPCLDNTTRAHLNSAIDEKLSANKITKDYQLDRGIKELAQK